MYIIFLLINMKLWMSLKVMEKETKPVVYYINE